VDDQVGRVLTVEDDHSLAAVIGLCLREQGLETLTASDGYEALRVAAAEHPDLVILDVMMPRMDGLETCRRLKQMADVPVLMISALTAEKDVIRGFDAGADDYLRKPFSLAELSARVRALLRPHHSSGVGGRPTVLVNGDLVVDLARRRVTLGARDVVVTATEFRLLAYIVQNAGRALTAREILDHVWGNEYEVGGGHLKVYVCYLRRKLGDHPQRPTYIQTIRGVGYAFREPPEQEHPTAVTGARVGFYAGQGGARMARQYYAAAGSWGGDPSADPGQVDGAVDSDAVDHGAADSGAADHGAVDPGAAAEAGSGSRTLA
jgi:DNA-binding response OmpR family regulator